MLNVIPKLGTTVAKFFSNLFTDVFNSIYNQQIDHKSARNVIIGFFIVAGITTAIVAGVNTYKSFDLSKDKKIEAKKPEVKTKKEKTQKSEVKIIKDIKKSDSKAVKKLKNLK